MKEYAEVSDGKIKVNRGIKQGENILAVGKDIKKGDRVLRKGTALRPHHIALLSLLRIARLKVYRIPKIAFFSTGDELQDLNSASKPNKIPDANRPFIKSSIESLNAEPLDLGIARDDEKQIRGKMERGLKIADALILSAGSSVGERDYVSKVAESFESVRTLVHGVAMRPSSPTGLAEYKGKPFILLPGFPTSAIVSFFVFARPAIWKLSGISGMEAPLMRARISEGIQARKGVRQFVRVQVSRRDEGYAASIVRPTEAQYSSWMKTANGIAIVDENDVGPNGEVDVFLVGDLKGEV
jgi:molybdenum cofactor synthesis domain-containing protein